MSVREMDTFLPLANPSSHFFLLGVEREREDLSPSCVVGGEKNPLPHTTTMRRNVCAGRVPSGPCFDCPMAFAEQCLEVARRRGFTEVRCDAQPVVYTQSTQWTLTSITDPTAELLAALRDLAKRTYPQTPSAHVASRGGSTVTVTLCHPPSKTQPRRLLLLLALVAALGLTLLFYAEGGNLVENLVDALWGGG
jgi:hypothetical protein